MSDRDEVVLCCANSYEQKYYLNPDFDRLPEAVKAEIKIMCVLFTEDIGGIILLAFDSDGNLKTESACGCMVKAPIETKSWPARDIAGGSENEVNPWRN